jgi:enoyl-[acyl-carrier protein] reductase II
MTCGIAPSPALSLAKRLVRSGADAIVIEGSETGRHIGPVSLTLLAQEILPHLKDVPMFVAGGLGRGEAILSYLEMGASRAQLGTGFAASEESIAHPEFLCACECQGCDAVGGVGPAVAGDPGAGVG